MPSRSPGIGWVELLVEHRVHQRGLVDRQLADRHHLARPEEQHRTDGALVVAHVAVAAETVRVHRDRRHHRLMTAHRRTVGADDGHAVAQHRDVGGGAADVGDDRVGEAGEMSRADQAGGRARRGSSRSVARARTPPTPATRRRAPPSAARGCPDRSSAASVVRTSPSMMEMSRALSTAVTARLGPLSRADR